jgi:hypothetical protein
MKAIGVFIALFLLDFVWAKYTYAMTERRRVMSAGLASVLILLSGGAAIGYTSDPWMLIPAMLGAFVGTWVAVATEELK